jgi:hypothetical protein
MAPDCAGSSTTAATNRVHPDKRHFSEHRFPSTWRGIKMMNPSKGGPVLLLHFHSQWYCHAGRCHGIVLENFSSTIDSEGRLSGDAAGHQQVGCLSLGQEPHFRSRISAQHLGRCPSGCFLLFFSCRVCWECPWVMSSDQWEYAGCQRKVTGLDNLHRRNRRLNEAVKETPELLTAL